MTSSKILFLSTLAGMANATGALAADTGWPMYNQTYDAQRYSPLAADRCDQRLRA